MEQEKESTTCENLRILVVDDDRNEREGIRFLIEKGSLPLTVTEAANGKQALERMQEKPFDILFTDIKMPYMDGLTLAQTVCAQFPAVKIIIFSAYGEFEYAQRAMEARENVRCVITIDHLEYSLNRMSKKDSFDTFYYVPSITLSGSVEYTNESTGELYWEEEATFLCLNAVDGSVIEQ